MEKKIIEKEESRYVDIITLFLVNQSLQGNGFRYALAFIIKER